MKIFTKSLSRARAFFQQSRLPMTKLSGVERTSGERLDILYAGSASQKPFIKGVYFSESISELDVGEHFSGAVNRVARRNGCQLVTAVQAVTARNLLPSDGYTLPLWITTAADSSESIHESRNSSLARDLKLIRKHGLTCEESVSPNDFWYFWERMYVPYAENRYAEQALLGTKEEFAKQIADGTLQLLFIIHDGRRIAGGALSTLKEIPRFRYLGILDADPELRKLGTLSAVYVHILDWALRRGHKEVNLGGVRPFLKDGVLQFKKKFNMRLQAGGYKRILYINPVSTGRAVTAALVSNPFIRVDRDVFVATYFESSDHESAASDTLWKVSGEMLPGLDRVDRIDLT